MDGTIPDTLLLEDRARAAMNAIAGLIDERGDGLPFFSANLLARPAYVTHGDWDYGSCHGRMTDAAILARHMTGSDQIEEAETHYKAGLVSFLGDDGLSYRQPHHRGTWEPNANLIDQRATLLALTTWYMSTGDPAVKAHTDRMVAALKRIAIKERTVWYYPASEYTKDGWPSANAAKLRLAPDPAAFCGRLIMPLGKYFELTGNEDAFELCAHFTRLIVERSGVFHEDGSFNDALAYRSGHFHTRLGTLDGMARFARLTGDHALSSYVLRSFNWALGNATRFGWTPGDLHEQRFEHETCSLVDLISIGLTLAQSGWTEHWETVERLVRNHLSECQLLSLDWVESAPDRSRDEDGWRSYYRVAERIQGAFAGYGAPNDVVADFNLGRGHINDVQACCLGAAVRGMFNCWSQTVTESSGHARINLLLNRGTPWLDVDSYLPHQGRLDVTAKTALRSVSVRIPAWAGYAHVRVSREGPGSDGETVGVGSDPALWAADGYLRLRGVEPGERVIIEFPVPEQDTIEYAAGLRYETHWRGDDVVGIRPSGRVRPLYADRVVYESVPRRAHRYHVPAVSWTW